MAEAWANAYPEASGTEFHIANAGPRPCRTCAMIRTMTECTVDLRKEQNDLLSKNRPRHHDGPACSAPTGCRRCWSRSYRRTIARRCA